MDNGYKITLILDNFPYKKFPKIRESQKYILNKIQNGLNGGKRMFILEAPTGIGKSAIAITCGKHLGGCYIVTMTKELQSQYCNDFPYIRKITGRSDYICPVQEYILGDKPCDECINFKRPTCIHKTADFGPCRTDQEYMGEGCLHHTSPILEHYKISNHGMESENIVLIKKVNPVCDYYDQKSKGILSSHTVTNYSSYLTHFRKSIIHDEDEEEDPEKKPMGLGSKRLIVFDECHNIENRIIELVGYNISSKRYHEITGEYLPKKDIKTTTTDEWVQVLEHFIKSFEKSIGEKRSERKKLEMELIGIESNLRVYEENDEPDHITEMQIKRLKKESFSVGKKIRNLKISIRNLKESKDNAIDTHQKIRENIDGWVVTVKEDEIIKDKIRSITFKPIDISEYCNRLFREDKGDNFLLMSATILDIDIYCKSIGLDPNYVEYISLQSEFPINNRPIYYVYDAPYLNIKEMDKNYVLDEWARIINTIMNAYHDFKGIIHVGAISHMEFISSRLSKINADRLIKSREGMHEITRDEVMARHTIDNKPTVIISPSFHTGIDLKDNLSRFQIIAKVLYPGIADAWVKKKKEINEEWYRWLTTLNFVQAYGRSIRSKSDWADTYLTDQVFRQFLNGNNHISPNPFIPKWVKDAMKQSISVDDVKRIADRRRF